MATNEGGTAPRAVIHKRILDSAESEPNASLEALAAEVPGASPDLVERVLEEYGDPGDEEPAETTEEPPMSEPVPPSTADLSEKQRATLEALAEHPDATQAELADELGVSRATVNKRLNDIDGFDWTDREAFVTTVLDDGPAQSAEDGDASNSADAATADEAPTPEAAAAVDGGQLLDPDADEAVEQLQERLARLEQRLDEPVDGTEPAIEDSELLAKVLRAVMADDEISEAEEVAVLEALR